jgi:hypothetical protein
LLFALDSLWAFTIELLFHQPTHLELHDSSGRDLNAFESLWVLRFPGGTCPGLEDAEIAEFQAIVAGKLADNLIEKRLNDGLDHHPSCICVFRYAVD